MKMKSAPAHDPGSADAQMLETPLKVHKR